LILPIWGGCGKSDGKCYVISDEVSVQDAYKLNSEKKWDNILKFINEIKSKTIQLALNFLNIARNAHTIETNAIEINGNMDNYIAKNSIKRQWIVMDYPSDDIIRNIYSSNYIGDENPEELDSDSLRIDNKKSWNELHYNIKLPENKSTRDNKQNNPKCLQRKIYVDKQNIYHDINKNVVFEYTDDGLIKSPLSPNEYLSKGDRKGTSDNETNGYLNPCNGSEKQVWQIWSMQPNTLFEATTQDIWVYNPELNKCLVSSNKLTN